MVLNAAPITPEDDEDSINLMKDNPQCMTFVLFMIWWVKCRWWSDWKLFNNCIWCTSSVNNLCSHSIINKTSLSTYFRLYQHFMIILQFQCNTRYYSMTSEAGFSETSSNNRCLNNYICLSGCIGCLTFVVQTNKICLKSLIQNEDRVRTQTWFQAIF